MYLSTIAGSRIISPEGCELGYALGVLLNKTRTKLSALLCADGEENEFYIPARAILSVGDVIVCNDLRAVEAEGKTSPVGLSAYSDRGLSLGIVHDMSFEEDGAYLMLDDGTRYSAARARFGQVVIIRSEVPARKPYTAEKKKQAPVPAALEQPLPTATEYNRLNLLGRRLKKSVYDSDGTLVARAGERITPEILSFARKRNRLLQLTVNTLTNIDF